jgi:hypothetical protein
MTGSDEDSYGRAENLHCGDLDAIILKLKMIDCNKIVREMHESQ